MSTKIEWATDVWNPTTGCTKVSEGCRNCYIERTPPFRVNRRRFVNPRGGDSGDVGATTGVILHEDRLEKPLRHRRPERYFVNSLSDLFHDDVPDEFIAQVFAVMAATQRHRFMILTKRHARMTSLIGRPEFKTEVGRLLLWGEFVDRELLDAAKAPGGWPLRNVALGVSVEAQKVADLRIPKLLATPAAVRFLSCEPLLGPIELKAHWLLPTFPGPRIDWLIVGGESGGPFARPMHPAWARALREQTTAAGASYFFKQWGSWAQGEHVTGHRAKWVDLDGTVRPWENALPAPGGTVMHYCGPSPKAGGRELDGREWNQMPDALVLERERMPV